MDAIRQNDESFKKFLLSLCDGDLQQYNHLLRSPLKDYLIKVENYINTLNGRSGNS